jgi:hypothetical protein
MSKRSPKETADVKMLARYGELLMAGKAMEPPALPDGRNPAAVMLGRLGGLVGGRRRAETLSPERRKEIARAAAKARWAKPRDLKA